jgi:tetratricopeptide (TPR) repeat protein
MRKIALVIGFVAVFSAASFAFDFKLPGGGDAKQQKAQGFFDEARRAYGSANYYKVIELASKAIQESPNFAPAFMIRGKAQKDLGDVDNALKDLNKAIELDPKLAEAYFNRGQVSEINGDMKNSRADYKKACDGGLKDACK